MVGYGGGDFTLGARALYFADQESGRLFVQDLPSGEARPISPAYGKASSPTPSPDGRWIAYIHHDPDGVDRLALVDARGEGWPRILHQGHDFYMQPRWSADGQFLAFVAWDHPACLQDGARLVPGPDGADRPQVPKARWSRGPVTCVRWPAGTRCPCSSPSSSPSSKALWFLSRRRAGRGSLDLADGTRRRLTAGEAEHGQPAWVQDMRSYAIAEEGRAVYAVRSEGGRRRLYRIDAASGSAVRVEALAAYDDIASIHTDARGKLLGLIASGSRQASRVLSYDTATGSLRVLARASGETLDPADLANPEALSWPGPDGHAIAGLYYAPSRRALVATGRPP